SEVYVLGTTRLTAMPKKPLRQPLEEERRVARRAVGQEGVAGDAADLHPAEARVEALGVAARSVEDEERLAGAARRFFGSLHQARPRSAAADAAVHEHLGDVGTVRLIFRLREDDLHRADDRTVGLFGDEKGALALRGALCDRAPERARLVPRQRAHEA